MKLLITGALKKDDVFFDSIRSLGHDITFIEDERIPLADQNIDPADFDGVICNALFLNNDIRDFTNLKYIQLTSAGYDRVPMDYILAHHIEIHNAAGVYSIPMAEFALGKVLEFYKQSRFFYDNQKIKKWEKHRGLNELFGRTVCIIGCGSVGTECAKRFSAFGCNVIGVDIIPIDSDAFSKTVGIESLDDAIGISDVVVLALPLTESTRNLVDANRLAKFKRGAILVNISRGGVVDMPALIKALPDLGGAVLDVFENEPLEENSPLWDMENVIITPHNSFVGDGNELRIKHTILNNLVRK